MRCTENTFIPVDKLFQLEDLTISELLLLFHLACISTCKSSCSFKRQGLFIRAPEMESMAVDYRMQCKVTHLPEVRKLAVINLSEETEKNVAYKKKCIERFLLNRWTSEAQEFKFKSCPLNPMLCHMLESTIADFDEWSINAHLRTTLLMRCLLTVDVMRSVPEAEKTQRIFQIFCNLMENRINEKFAEVQDLRTTIKSSVMDMSSTSFTKNERDLPV
ncbi:hypothetical protein L596_009823 [Steinernema carpocapsae]|uniref:Uncharacterized protein n=1 Tax=Steinernema carpocapsae TaxID=34508 RepID=A0A4U5PHA4_STECR|nr:hypothetical protein L596_009823 [Steinernema carpocapsae]